MTDEPLTTARRVLAPAVDGHAELPGDDGWPFDFAPVPRPRARRDGWTAERQRDFLLALARCGSVAAAARAVGMAPRSAYRLIHADGADDFARAWDVALDIGREMTRTRALDRVLHGELVPLFRKGRIANYRLKTDDRLAIALLSGRADAAPDRLGAAERRAHRQRWAAHDERQARQLDALEAEVTRLRALLAAARRDPGPRRQPPRCIALTDLT